MSTNFSELPVRSQPPAPSFWATAVRGWNRFWFTPSDPTLLGLLRICTGLLALFTVFTYTWELQSFFGKDAWMNFDLRQKSRRESPTFLEPLQWTAPQAAEHLNHLNLTDKQHQDLLKYIWAFGDIPPTELLTSKELNLNADQIEKIEYIRDYENKWHQLPPLPFPKDKAEADQIDRYIETWRVDPRTTYLHEKGAPEWSIWFHVTDPAGMMVVHCLFILATLFFALGLGTRVTSVVSWFAAMCYIHRSPITIFGGDTMLIILLFYLMIGPSGAALSLDRLIARWWRRRRRGEGATANGEDAEDRVKPLVGANVALRMLQIHVCFVYAAAGLSKLQGNSWWTGTAIWGTLANSEFAPTQLGWYMFVLRTMASHLWFLQLFLALGTYFTLFFEISYSYLIWGKYTRWLMLIMAVMLHGVIGLFMGLKTFALVMLIMNAAFLPPETVRWLVRLFRQWGHDLTMAAKPTPQLAGVPAPAPTPTPAPAPREPVALSTKVKVKQKR
jgi:hypothetical protein